MDPRELLEANDRFAIPSFLHALHELNEFDCHAFEMLCCAVSAIGSEPPLKRGAKVAREATRVHRTILMLIIHHLNPRDGCFIAGLPVNDLHDALDRLGAVFLSVIDGVAGRTSEHSATLHS